MTVSIQSLMVDDGPAIMYSAEFQRMIEDHMRYLKEDALTESIQIDNQVANKSHGDLYSVLYEYNVPRHLHWIVMRMNNYSSPMEYDSEHVVLLVPSPTTIENLLKTFRVNYKISQGSNS